MTDYQSLWAETFSSLKESQITAKGFKETDVRAGGRATKAHPNKEDEAWWHEHGPGMVESWVKWRDESGYQIAEIAPGVPAVEVSVTTQISDLTVQMHIDRVMFMPSADGEITRNNFVVLDLKSGKNPPKSDLQLAFYAAGLEKQFGWRPRWGTYWMAREGTIGYLVDLDMYPTFMIEDLLAKFKSARENKIFLPNMSHCPMCSVKDHCKYRNPELWEI
jgi:hypothetical protein